jgi:hypothetical protein
MEASGYCKNVNVPSGSMSDEVFDGLRPGFDMGNSGGYVPSFLFGGENGIGQFLSSPESMFYPSVRSVSCSRLSSDRAVQPTDG